MGDKINELVMFSAVVISGLSLLLFIISMLSYSRLREIKLLFISLSFLVFFIKAILFIFINNRNLIVMDLLIIAFLYIAAAKK
ncbi:MAG: hypothetical protein FE044_02025 [Thermoplasmata archaeon]|nr:MAG: hypothetical protein FE044_02025 [Thermoplasmata archaeon]MCD6572705.1 hypothetical protein [Thermoplasmata archaeon]